MIDGSFADALEQAGYTPTEARIMRVCRIWIRMQAAYEPLTPLQLVMWIKRNKPEILDENVPAVAHGPGGLRSHAPAFHDAVRAPGGGSRPERG